MRRSLQNEESVIRLSGDGHVGSVRLEGLPRRASTRRRRGSPGRRRICPCWRRGWCCRCRLARALLHCACRECGAHIGGPLLEIGVPRWYLRRPLVSERARSLRVAFLLSGLRCKCGVLPGAVLARCVRRRQAEEERPAQRDDGGCEHSDGEVFEREVRDMPRHPGGKLRCRLACFPRNNLRLRPK